MRIVSYEEGAGRFPSGKKFDDLVISVQPYFQTRGLAKDLFGCEAVSIVDNGASTSITWDHEMGDKTINIQGRNVLLIAMTPISGQTFLYHRLAASLEKAQYNTNDHAKENQLCHDVYSRTLPWGSHIRSRSFCLFLEFIPQRHIQLVAWHRRKSRSDEFFTHTYQQFQSITSDGRWRSV